MGPSNKKTTKSISLQKRIDFVDRVKTALHRFADHYYFAAISHSFLNIKKCFLSFLILDKQTDFIGFDFEKIENYLLKLGI